MYYIFLNKYFYVGRGAGVRKSLPARGAVAEESHTAQPTVIPNQVSNISLALCIIRKIKCLSV